MRGEPVNVTVQESSSLIGFSARPAKRHLAPLGSIQSRLAWRCAARPEPTTISKLARTCQVTRQTIHTVVGEMSDRGLVEVSGQLHDKKSKLVSLTPTGRKLVKRLNCLGTAACEFYEKGDAGNALAVAGRLEAWRADMESARAAGYPGLAEHLDTVDDCQRG